MLLSATNLIALGCSRAALWAGAKSGFAMASIAVTCCVLALVGSGFDYHVANAAALSDDAMAGGTDLLAWNSVLGNVVTGSLGIIAAAALVLALGLWTAPQATAQVVSPQRQLYDAAD